MKKILLFLFSITLSVSLLANSDNYNFPKLKEKMEKDGFKLEYVKKDSGFNFKKGNSHVEVVDYKSYAKLNDAIANSINLLEEKGFKLVPGDCDFGNGVLVFSNPNVKDYAFVLSANYKKNIILNTGGTPKDIEFSVKTLQETLKPTAK
ncbi:hypothetical protein [Candidatus Cetobacterium colombiensis]|uniref:DUF4252 domain-containing protein n=1 Tax=Candidatus Cetobacterium colombiensis TaxID=3073100 RepID=A0ABU4WAQ1_9FUSO|nr:hypothetical protein [Candidatus Cetobacterium colombiensis]MDX8336617.1 hypothetical protein [Candidatus Cetobacterium colombiensis]